jgi:hypothetical protein
VSELALTGRGCARDEVILILCDVDRIFNKIVNFTTRSGPERPVRTQPSIQAAVPDAINEGRSGAGTQRLIEGDWVSSV